MVNSTKGYCYTSNNQHFAYAELIDSDKGETLIYYDDKPLDKLPKDYVCDLKLFKSDLYVVYQRAILKVPNIEKNDIPTEEFTISMQDYYSYENPQLFDFKQQTLYVSIGGRFFVWDERQGRWIEKAQFFIGDGKPLVLEDGTFVFSTNLQKDNDLEGVKLYNSHTGKIKFFAIPGAGKSPEPQIFENYI